MSTTLRVQATLPTASGLAKDEVVNTWHFASTDPSPAVDAAIAYGYLSNFYGAIDGLMSSKLAGTVDFKVYDLRDAEPRTPIYTNFANITPGTGQCLPHEVAICVSYRGTFVSGSDPKRRRGRIFIGPWDVAVMDDGTADAIVDAGAQGAINTAAGSLYAAGLGQTCQWAVFSPTTAGTPPWSAGTLIASTLSVQAGYVDNAFDIIRSRGTLASLRVVFP